MLLHRRVSISGLALALVAGLTLPAAGQDYSSPLTGTWKLNVEKSKYTPADLAPKAGTTRFEVRQGGLRAVVDGVDAKGRKTHQEYRARFDGNVVACGCTIDGQPNPDQDGIAWKKIDENTFELTNMLKGKALTSQRIVVAADGKTRTNTVSGQNAQGVTVSNTVIYEKQ